MKLITTSNLQSEIYTPVTPPPVWTPLEKPLNECKVGLTSACGVHLKTQEPFGKAGDFTWREIPKTVKPEELMVTHGGYDNGDVNRDINCMFPYQRLIELEKEGFIKEFADVNVGFMGGGGIQEVFQTTTGPNVTKILKEQDVDIVLLTAG